MAGRGAAGGGGGSAPAFVTSVAGMSTSVDQLLIIPGTVVVGQVMVAAHLTFSASTHTTPTGWTLLNSTTGAGTYPVRISTYSRIVQSGDASSTVTFNQSVGNHAIAQIAVYGPGAIDVTGAAGSGADGSSIVAPTVTATASVTALRFFGGMGNGGAPTFTYPATNRRDDLQGWMRLGFSDAPASAGATGTATTTVTGFQVMWAAATVAIKA